MSVLIETTVGDFVVDLFCKERPTATRNFLKLCKYKYYNLCQFFNIQKDYIAQTGDPTGTGKGGESIFRFDENEDAGKTAAEIQREMEDRDLKTHAQILEMVGDIRDVDEKPPDNTKFASLSARRSSAAFRWCSCDLWARWRRCLLRFE
ncbi:Peptidyl-prolyl cis-trans isomerase [Aphelenchoides fujianensis]|nr:Peptidyl-prolyl cis-trans isomerase [Aphelenchoides fujianensis]